jgi:hypothetical protein
MIGVEANRASQPISVGCKIASIECIHGKMLRSILITAPMRSIIQASPAERLRNPSLYDESVGERDHCGEVATQG